MQVALLTTMVLGSLWNGASWNFVIWGTLHGLFLVAERTLATRFGEAAWTVTAPARFAFVTLTFDLVCIAWVFDPLLSARSRSSHPSQRASLPHEARP